MARLYNSGTITNCYYLETPKSDSNVIPMSADEMQHESFVTTLNENAATYNTSATVKACEWIATEEYPIIKLGVRS
ncbi:MAG: hypothetical protein R3Y51_02705 [Rikenellaceae bacterium]